jgi:hypothetical protein
MAVTIETGAGVAGADSYITAAEFRTLESALFTLVVTGTDAAREVGLRRAWVYLRALDWNASTFPLFGGTIPDVVKQAQMVLARAEIASEGTLSPDVTLSGKKVLTSVGDLGWTLQSTPNTVQASRPVISMAMDLLRPYLTSGSTTFLERA